MDNGCIIKFKNVINGSVGKNDERKGFPIN